MKRSRVEIGMVALGVESFGEGVVLSRQKLGFTEAQKADDV